ncbi:MAG: peptidase M28 family protein [Bacteroidetes bacterium]|nr:MAG: peptidase M28 family protein [Bacteroidota bacterium]
MLLSLLLGACQPGQQQPSSQDEQMIAAIFEESLEHGQAYSNLEQLCKQIGGRLSGSVQAARAVTYTRELMEALELDRVFLQEVMVPHWERGPAEVAEVYPKDAPPHRLAVCALGGSVGTNGPLRAQVVEVKDFEQLSSLGREQIAGKFVFYNRSMRAQFIQTFRAYGSAVNQRTQGAMEAAKYGAVGSIVRSMTQTIDDYPHTGAMRYDEQLPKIPAAAISTQAAEWLSIQLQSQPELELMLEMHCQTLPDTLSHNVVGEIRGSEFPDEIILVGGHLDSWDLGEGAHDDGAGCVQAIEVLRIFQALGIRPKRTLRAVMFMNEENGLRGGRKYAELAKELGEHHIAAIESDRGGFTPRGFTIQAEGTALKHIQQWQPLLAPYGGRELVKGGGGADIGPLREQGTLLIGYSPDSQRYFDYHHAATDRFENVNRRELQMGAAMIASLVYLIDQYGLK